VKITDYIDDDYIHTYHLPADRDVPVTITDARVEDLPKRDRMPASRRISLGVKGSKRRLILNKTNSRTLLLLGFADTDALVGKRIILRVGRFPRDPSKEDRVVIMPRLPGSSTADGQVSDDARPPEPAPEPSDTNGDA
jgi:hypothetical protein